MQEEKESSILNTFQSEDLIEKLKLLNYEEHLLQDLKMKPITRFYFVKYVNPGEQFYMFTLICWWLCLKLGKTMERPQEYDDPNLVIENIIKILDDMDVHVDFAPNKLIRGAGCHCVYVLDTLATHVLKLAKITFQPIVIPQDDETAVEYVENDAEIILERLEVEEHTGFSDDSDLELDAEAFKQLNWSSHLPNKQNAELEHDMGNNKHLIEYQKHWREECERVLPQLKVYVKTDARDWRSHLTQMETLKSNIEEAFDETQTQLKKLHNEFTFNLEKIESREKHLNNELQQLISQFKEVSVELSNVNHAQEQLQNDMEGMQTQLSAVIKENEMKKSEMERRGQAISDASK